MNKKKPPTRSEKAIAKWLSEGFSDKTKVKAHLAELCDVTRQAVGDWCKFGKVDKRHFSKISKYLGSDVPIEAFEDDNDQNNFIVKLHTGSGKSSSSMLIANKIRQKISEPKHASDKSFFIGHIDAWDSDTDLDEDETEIPFFMEVELAAGMGSDLAQENHGPKLRFSKSTLSRCGVDPANAACVKVSGDSMEPRLFNGDVVGVDLGNKRIVDGKTYAINHDGLLRIKRLYLLPGGGLRINSFNLDDYQDEVLSSEDRGLVSVIGKVFWSSSIWA